jgi:hypothetical protein
VVLIEGLFLVAFGGAIGLAVGTYVAHPIAGLAVAMVLGLVEADLLVPFGAPVQAPGRSVWLFAWAQPAALRWLPKAAPGVPPVAHLAWLAALTGMAAIAVTCQPGPRRRPGRASAVALVVCLVAAGWSGWQQVLPVSAGSEEGLAYLSTHPEQTETCEVRDGVKVCAYPGFLPDVGRWAAVAWDVLRALPKAPAIAPVVRQVVDVDFFAPPFSIGSGQVDGAGGGALPSPTAQLGRFVDALGTDPGLVGGSSRPPIYVDINWGAGSRVGSYQFGLALQVAWWLAGLPTTRQGAVWYRSGPRSSAEVSPSCLPVDQAREAVALWLAASATPGAREFFLNDALGAVVARRVGPAWVAVYPGVSTSGYQPAVQFTVRGAELARAMLRLPGRRVEGVLARGWPRWLAPGATDEQLEAALGTWLPERPWAPGRSPGEPVEQKCH